MVLALNLHKYWYRVAQSQLHRFEPKELTLLVSSLTRLPETGASQDLAKKLPPAMLPQLQKFSGRQLVVVAEALKLLGVRNNHLAECLAREAKSRMKDPQRPHHDREYISSEEAIWSYGQSASSHLVPHHLNYQVGMVS